MQDNDDSNKDENMLVAVSCCGYRSIISPKTQLTFPAWLIRFPNENNKYCQYWWRSKRDFTILARAAVACTADLQPPKAVLRKLAERAPWRRPDDNHYESFVQDPLEENNYHVSMKKSIQQLDQYLNAISKRARQTEPLSKAWNDFCRKKHVEGLTDGKSTVTLSCNETTVTLVTSPYESSQLGQYFCTKENAHQVNTTVDCPNTVTRVTIPFVLICSKVSQSALLSHV